MSEEEANDTFQKLIKVLDDCKMDWLVRQVRAEIREGKPSPVHEVVESKSSTPVKERLTSKFKKSSSSLIGSKDYTAIEKLRLLITAIERVTVEPFEMWRSIELFWKEQVSAKTDVQLDLKFEPDDESPYSWYLESTGTGQYAEWAEGMKKLINEVKAEVNAD